MGMRGIQRLAGVILAAALSMGAAERPRAAIVGTVFDSEWEHPLPGVSVTANSSTAPGEIRTETDAAGAYRLDGVPPGTYSIRFEQEKYTAHSQERLEVAEGSTLRVDVGLSEKAPTFHVRCGGISSDLAHTPRSYTAPRVVVGLPVGRPRGGSGGLRAAESLAELSPVTLLDASGFAIRGASASENGYLLEGFSTRDAVTGLNLVPLSMEFVSLVTVHAGGSMPDQGRANGGVIEARLPTGCTRISGSAFASWTPGGLEGPRESIPNAGSVGTSRNGLKNLGDFGITLGGPLVRNRLSFFAGVVPTLSRNGRRDDLTDHRGIQAVGRLTYHVAPGHDASLLVLATPSLVRGTDTADRPWEFDSETVLGMFDYNGMFLDNHLLLSFKAGWLNHKAVSRVSTGDARRAQRRFHAKTEGYYLLHAVGTHVFKASIDAEHSMHDSVHPVASRAASTVLGGFVQDTWTVSHLLTLQGGARYDVQSLWEGLNGRRALTTYLLSPRAGVVINPRPMYHSQLFASFAKYHDLVPLGLMDAESGQGVTFDPNLVPTSSREVIVGASHEFRPTQNGNLWFQLAAHYARRRLDAALASLDNPDDAGVLIGNPGVGLAAALPRAVRTYDAVTVSVQPNFHWMRTQFSYTWSRLHGNQTEPLGADAGRPLARQQLLPADRTHSIKATGIRGFDLARKLLLLTGVSYQGASGTPRDDLGTRNRWVHVLDAHVDLKYQVSRFESVSFELAALNLLNTQPGAWLGEGRSVESDGVPPLYVLPPLQVRFGVRYAF
ncbi:TonB-dependent receptor [Myxococcus sp. NMCA1]|uniref:TonB-dependent receptor n=1 Tax=Myxococcus sp. NMCA1 TaxID=2996785 RepID=UPI0022855AFB|nr:TonB-dependent receptor [Myxococcus sp. NMCA1]WAM28692.1 TonB-dependent receptor [Myxococcus sp. NMCA1]